MTQIMEIKVFSLAKILALILGLAGVGAGILYAGGGAIYDAFTVGLNQGTALAFLALIGMPIIFASFGFVLGAVVAFTYNMISARIGGIEIELEQ